MAIVGVEAIVGFLAIVGVDAIVGLPRVVTIVALARFPGSSFRESPARGVGTYWYRPFVLSCGAFGNNGPRFWRTKPQTKVRFSAIALSFFETSVKLWRLMMIS